MKQAPMYVHTSLMGKNNNNNNNNNFGERGRKWVLCNNII